MPSTSVACEGRVVALREDYSDYMPQLASRVDDLLRNAAQTRDSVAQLVERLRKKHAGEYGSVTEEAVRQRLVRLFSSGAEGVVVDGRGYVLGRRERGRRVLEVRRDDAAALRHGDVVSALGRPREAYFDRTFHGSGSPRGPYERDVAQQERRRQEFASDPRDEAVPVVDLSRIEAMLVRPAAGGLPAYTAIQVLGQLQAELFELRKAVDDLRHVVTKEDAS